MIERIKQHVKDHKVVYACGATAVVTAGITCLVMRSSSISGGYRTSGGSLVDIGFPQTASHSFNGNTNSFNTTNNNFVNRLSYIVRDPASDKWWTSQADLGRDLEISDHHLSQWFNHGRPIPGHLDFRPVREGVKSAA